MSHDSNFVSLKKAFTRSLAEPRLFGIVLAEAGAVLLVAILLYAITLRLLMTMFSIPVETLMTFFANGALPPEANQLITTMIVVSGIVLFVLIAFFEAGLFGTIVKKKESFFSMAKKLFLAFFVVLIFFELTDVVTMIFYLPVALFAWWVFVANLLTILVQLFFIAWQMIASFTVVKHGPLVSLKKSFFTLTKNLGYWGKAVFVTVVFVLVALFIIGALLYIATLIHPVVIGVVALIVVVAALYLSLVLRIFFWNRMK